MGLLQQTWTLTRKNLLIVFVRHWMATTLRAFVLPIVFMFFISYAKNFFVEPSQFGVGTAVPVKSLTDALNLSSGRNIVAFVNNGYTGGDIANVIDQMSQMVSSAGAGMTVQVVPDEVALLTTCRSTLRGASNCYAAANFHASPNQGLGGFWNYTIHADGALGAKIYVNKDNNDQEIYLLPFQHAIDSIIATIDGSSIPATVNEYPYTYETNEQRARAITRAYQGAVINILAVAFFLAVVGVTYQLVGQMASERELGMSQLIEAMMPNERRWEPQVARILSYHFAFDIIYLPSWIIMAIVVWRLVFPDTSVGILIGLHLLVGLSLSSYSILFGSFFRKAQLSGITTTIVSLVLAIVAQVAVGSDGSTGAIVVLSLLFPPMNYVFSIINMAKFQQINRPTNLTQNPPNSVWEIPGIVLWILLAVQIIVFPVLGALVERSLYGTASTDRKVSHESDPMPVSVKLSSFSKHYGPGRFKRMLLSCIRRKRSGEVIAVNDLTLDVLQGQIFVLLGANGSGKSTTLDAISGLNTVTSGSIEIDGRGGLGLCPQKNVLWDEVTVFEHVNIFNTLKQTDKKASRAETEELIAACDMAVKLKAKSKTLSGGQKRKLQLAMMFTGGSRVCCIDEVSSGIDPLARRKIWDILLAERGRRTLILTTHFLDEADVLSDHIAILSKGVLKAEGSAVELKHRLGSGYRVIIETAAGFTPEPAFRDVPTYIDYDQTIYQLKDSAETSRFISSIESHGNCEYRVQGPTVEDVFLKLADEIKDDFGAALAPKTGVAPSDEVSEDITYPKETPLNPKEAQMNLLPGEGTALARQTWVLFRKRLAVLRYNYMPYCAAVVIPVIAAGLVTLFLKNFSALGCSPTSQISIADIDALSTLTEADLVYGPPSRISEADVQLLYPGISSNSLHPVNTIAEFNAYIDTHYGNVTPGGIFLGDTPTFAYIGNYDVSLSVLVQNLANVALSRSNIITSFSNFAVPWAPSAGKTLQLILYFGLAMSAYPGFFALYVTSERLRNVRALHYSNGVRAAPLWLAYTLFDFMFVLLISVICIALFLGLWSGWYYPGYLFVVFFLYGLTSAALSYLISLFVTSQLAAFAFAAGLQCILFLIYLITYLCIITYAQPNMIDHYIRVAHFTISIITPAGNLLRALLLTLNEFSTTCDGFALASYPGAITVYGGPIVYLIVQFFLLLTFVIWWDSGGRLILFKRSAHRAKDAEEIHDQDPEVFEETARVEHSDDALRVLHVTKVYGSNLAVDDVSFGIRKGECFSLLGPNGAGKSTTISLIRGDVRLTVKESEIFVDGVSLASHRVAARNHLGVCPQFDAMDQMTVLGHLRFYARIRGVPDIEHNVREVMRGVGIQQYANRMALTLSGGNKRKLSLAIALMGNPSVVLLDEPSSGMDAAAKRVMWRVLGSIKEGRALLITTHSMEEADALAQRAGIMARRMLALGTIETLRKRHGDAHYVHIVHKEAPHTSFEEMARIKDWARQHITGAVVEDRTYHGQLRFSVPNAIFAGVQDEGMPSSSRMSPTRGTSALFKVLEENKYELGIAYYSVSPTTLDQVFLNVVNKHNVEEENYNAGKKEGGRKGVAARVVERLSGENTEV